MHSPWDAQIFACAAWGGDMDILKWLHSVDCLLDALPMDITAGAIFCCNMLKPISYNVLSFTDPSAGILRASRRPAEYNMAVDPINKIQEQINGI